MKRKYAIIVGASRGIGQSVAITMARLGFINILIGRTREGLQETAARCGVDATVHTVTADITAELLLAVEQVTEITDRAHFLWLGAAGFSDEPISSMTLMSIREIIRSGYESQVELVHLLYPLLKVEGAQIIGACSDWSDFNSGGPSVFGSTKVALAGFLDKLRLEAKGDGIQVTSLKMGNVGNLEGYELEDFDRQYRETGRKFVSLRDVCDAVEFIISRKTGMVSELTLVPGG